MNQGAANIAVKIWILERRFRDVRKGNYYFIQKVVP